VDLIHKQQNISYRHLCLKQEIAYIAKVGEGAKRHCPALTDHVVKVPIPLQGF